MKKTGTYATDARRLLFGSIALAWGVMITVSLVWNWLEASESAFLFAAAEARASYNKDLVYRRWASLQGGVYVPPTEMTPPSPYLSHIPERDLITTGGKRLTLVNPAYMTRQVYSLAQDQYGTRGHITSLKPLRPENAADLWETAALRSFAAGVGEVVDKERLDGRLYLRFMRPLVTEKSCLKCHAFQGYREGDIRGGISVSVPFAPYDKAMRHQRFLLLLAHVLLGGLGFFGLWRGSVLLAKNEGRHRRILQMAPDGYWLVDRELRLLEVNEAYCRMSGYSEEELLKMKVSDLEVSESASDTAEHLARVMEQREDRFETRHRRKDGSIFLLHVCVQYHAEGGGRLTAFLHDITERRRAEDALQESEAKYRSYLQNAPYGVFVVDNTGAFLQVNPVACRMSGYAEHELLLMRIPDLHPREAVEGGMRAFQQVIEEGWGQTELAFCRKDGSMRWWSVSAVRLPPASVLGFCDDITERRQAEEDRQRLQEQLAQSQKMESVGRLAGGVAHDFNNMLGVILGNVEMALDHLPPDLPVHSDLLEIRVAARRSADLTRQLLAFARRQTAAPKILDLNETIAGMLPMLQRLIGADIELIWQPGAGLWPVRIDPGQIDQILANLCVNARAAIALNGRITITTRNLVFTEQAGAVPEDCAPGAYVQIVVQDNGAGMAEELLEHIFEPFFTTKNLGEGTGLGLATVYGIVRQNGGCVQVDSQPGKGATFRVNLPRHGAEMNEISAIRVNDTER